jgi:hypothetical protein
MEQAPPVTASAGPGVVTGSVAGSCDFVTTPRSPDVRLARPHLLGIVFRIQLGQKLS